MGLILKINFSNPGKVELLPQSVNLVMQQLIPGMLQEKLVLIVPSVNAVGATLLQGLDFFPKGL